MVKVYRITAYRQDGSPAGCERIWFASDASRALELFRRGCPGYDDCILTAYEFDNETNEGWEVFREFAKRGHVCYG